MSSLDDKERIAKDDLILTVEVVKSTETPVMDVLAPLYVERSLAIGEALAAASRSDQIAAARSAADAERKSKEINVIKRRSCRQAFARMTLPHVVERDLLAGTLAVTIESVDVQGGDAVPVRVDISATLNGVPLACETEHYFSNPPVKFYADDGENADVFLDADGREISRETWREDCTATVLRDVVAYVARVAGKA